MKHTLIKSLITNIVLCIIIITWTGLNDNLGYGVLAAFLYVIPVVFAGGLIFFFYYFKFINRILPIVIGYTILSLVAFGEDIYLHYQILRIEDHFFIAKKLNKEAFQNEKL